MFSRFRADTPARFAAVLLLAVLLLDFSARAAQDQHEFGAPAGHGLCAICVYTGASSGIPEEDWATPSAPQRHAAPTDHLTAGPHTLPAITTRIRGPPALA